MMPRATSTILCSKPTYGEIMANSENRPLVDGLSGGTHQSTAVCVPIIWENKRNWHFLVKNFQILFSLGGRSVSS
jgi:hypothetical protein